MSDLRLCAYGETAVIASLEEPDLTEQLRLVALTEGLREDREVLDAVLGFGSCTAFLRDAAARDRVIERMTALWESVATPPLGPMLDVPVRYGASFGEDFDELCRGLALTPAELVELHASVTYTVWFVGYRPGFAYMGDVAEALRIPRRAVPRPRVPARSVAIADRMTSIYPSLAPGGWHIIGTAACDVFDASRERPALLQAGMRVRFVPQ